MSRRVRVARPGAQAAPATAAAPVDTYFDKVVKDIPADIVGAWWTVSRYSGPAAVRVAPPHSVLVVALIDPKES